MGPFQPNRRRSQTQAPSQAQVPSTPSDAPRPNGLLSTPPLPILRSTPRPQTRPSPLLRSSPQQPRPLAQPDPQPPINHPSSPPLSERRPNHNIPSLHEFEKLLNFLLNHRPYHVPPFMNDCWKIYNKKYKTKKNPPAKPSNGQPPNQSELPQPPQLAANSQPPNQPIDVDHDSHLTNSEILDSPESQPHPTHPSASPRRNPFPICQIPLLDRQTHLDELVYERWNAFHHEHQNPPDHPYSPHSPQQEKQLQESFIIWQSPKSRQNPVLLDGKNCCLALQDHNANPSPIHLKALTFLWHNLIENPCTGAIFNHGIGYPRTHIIFLFAHLVLTSPGRQNNTILVICPPPALAQWEMSHDHFQEKVPINFLTKSAWQENINQWKARGGVLVADEGTYANILNSSRSPEKHSALAALCCPGPDICILDEAAKTNTRPASAKFRRFLYRTRTKARLALTSLPLAGFIARAWSIVDWACPGLFGTNIEYYSKFVHPIARGHECQSTTEEASEAFRRACLLFNKMSMVTFTIDSSTRRESLSSKGLSIHESVIWVNISRQEYSIYREVELFLSTAVREKGISPFLAVDLMICAASSVHALRRTVRTWANASPHCLRAIGDQAQDYFLKLLHIMDSRLKEDLTCTKLQLALYVGRQCLLTNERLVIFTSSQDLLVDVHKFLESQLDERKVYTYDAFMHAPTRENLPLDDFNTVQGGAILIAPYGPTIHCMEESGWGFINATRVLFIDSSWHSGACVQAVNRVHNFAQMNNDLHVHHFLARDTVEYGLSSVLGWRYEHMLGFDSSSLPGTMSDLDERGFLTAPEVSPKLIRNNPPLEISRTAAPSVKKRNTDEQDSSTAIEEHDDMILPLQKTTDNSNGDKYVHEIVLGSNRYRSMSENLDLWMRSEWSRKDRFLTEGVEETKSKELIKQHRESLHILGGYIMDAINRRLSGDWLAQDCIFMEDDMPVSHLLTSWEPYRRLFECAAVSNFPRLPENRGEKRPRPYDDGDDRHPKNMYREQALPT